MGRRWCKGEVELLNSPKEVWKIEGEINIHIYIYTGRLQQLHLDEDCTLLMMIWSIFQVLFRNGGSIFISKTKMKRE